MSTNLAGHLQNGIKKLQLSITEDQQNKLLLYVELIQKWNKAYNLTAIEDAEEIISKHILDSLTAVNFLQGQNIIDVGSGAGLPGIPLAIACSDKQFYLLDANIKKTTFIQQAIIELSIKNIKVIHQRVEQFAPQSKLNTVISRAFAGQAKLLEATHHLLNHGQIILMLGKQTSLQGLPKGYTVLGIHTVHVPNLQASRHIAVIEKI
ncbi:MAG: 16S rRNA (guanine(527)-N(7))-methyltransferase RsmG [Gammaproteobacteria bacterium]